MANAVHSTALVDPGARIHPTASIGAFSIIGPAVTVGADVEIGHHCVLEGRVELAPGVKIGHGSILGGRPQDLKFKEGTPSGVRIGAKTVVREYVTIHRATRADGWTDVGAGCLVMAMSHIAHDCKVGDGAIIINYAGITGHCEIGECATIGGLTGMVPFTRIGAYAYVGGVSKVNADVPPYMLVDGSPAVVRGVDVVGLRRAGMPAAERRVLQDAYRLLYRSGLAPQKALERIRSELPALPTIVRLAEFIAGARHGICGPPRRGAGVVGAGHMGQYHILVYAELWDIELAGVVDVDRDRATRVAAHYDTRAFADHRDLIGRVDLVSVAVPTEQHFQVASDFLEAGVSVLLEKPIAPTLEEARELFVIAGRTGAVLHVGHVERFNGAVQELKKIVERPLLVESRRLGPFETRVQKDTVVMDLMIHDLDIVLGLIDSPPRRLTAMGSTVHSGSVDVANVQIAFESGTIAIITASRATEEKIRTLAVTQPDAYIVLDYSEQDIRVHRRAAQEYTLNRESIRYRRASFVEHVQVHKDNPLKLEILHLVRTVRRARAGETVVLAETEDLRSLAMALEIERMIRDGRCEAAYSNNLPWSDHSA